jgi:hypothetical protein
MARPRKDEFGRCERVNVRLTTEEKQELKRRAEACGLSGVEYMRRVMFGLPIVFKQKADPALIADLNDIGGKLNQMAKVFNSGAVVPPHALERELKRLNEALNRIEPMNEVTD